MNPCEKSSRLLITSVISVRGENTLCNLQAMHFFSLLVGSELKLQNQFLTCVTFPSHECLVL